MFEVKEDTYVVKILSRGIEEVYLRSYETVSECKQNIGKYIQKYNQERLHQSLNEYDTPCEGYLQTKWAIGMLKEMHLKKDSYLVLTFRPFQGDILPW